MHKRLRRDGLSESIRCLGIISKYKLRFLFLLKYQLHMKGKTTNKPPAALNKNNATTKKGSKAPKGFSFADAMFGMKDVLQ